MPSISLVVMKLSMSQSPFSSTRGSVTSVGLKFSTRILAVAVCAWMSLTESTSMLSFLSMS